MFNKLDLEIERFIDRRIHSPLDMDIIVYFHRNPVMVESAREIANRLGTDIKEVSKALHRFEARGIVRNMATRGTPLYAYSASNNLHSTIERFVKLVVSRQGRAIVDSKLIANGKV